MSVPLAFLVCLRDILRQVVSYIVRMCLLLSDSFQHINSFHNRIDNGIPTRFVDKLIFDSVWFRNRNTLVPPSL